jgi:phage terminase large subunit-like protein
VAPRKVGLVPPVAHTLVEERSIRQSLVRQYIRDLDEDYEVDCVIFDPHLFDPEELSDEGFDMIEFPQSPANLIPASKTLLEVISEGRMAHDGDPVLRSHVTSAATKDNGEGWRFSKAKSKKRIDALICMVMGIERAVGYDVVDEPMLVEFV